jgi:hypothetical protein
MSEENIEVVRRATELSREAYASGEPTDEMLSHCAPEIRVDSSRRVFNPAVFTKTSPSRSRRIETLVAA